MIGGLNFGFSLSVLANGNFKLIFDYKHLVVVSSILILPYFGTKNSIGIGELGDLDRLYSGLPGSQSVYFFIKLSFMLMPRFHTSLDLLYSFYSSSFGKEKSKIY